VDLEKAIQDFIDALQKLRDKLPEIAKVYTDAANSFLARYILRIGSAIVSAGKWLLEAVQKLLDKLLEYLRGCWAPVFFLKAASGWEDVQTKANNLNAGITSSTLSLGSWRGEAADAYRGATTKQGPAALRVASMSGTMKSAMDTLGAGGIAFYIGLTSTAISFIVELAAELGAAATVVAAIPAAAAAVLSSTKGILAVLALVGGVTALILTQKSNIQSLNVEGDSANGCDGGKWPKATVAGDYSDATVRDGDAKWSVKPA